MPSPAASREDNGSSSVGSATDYAVVSAMLPHYQQSSKQQQQPLAICYHFTLAQQQVIVLAQDEVTKELHFLFKTARVVVDICYQREVVWLVL